MAREGPGGYPALLRKATKTHHRRLDHHPLLAPLVSATVTRADYVQALSALHAPHDAIEHALRGFAPEPLFPARAPDLVADLTALEAVPLPLRAEPPVLTTTAMRVGAMYVIEGSNLGGTLIARELSKRLPADTPMRYFGAAGGAPRWDRFSRFIAELPPLASIDEAVDAARATFDFYGEHLDACQS